MNCNYCTAPVIVTERGVRKDDRGYLYHGACAVDPRKTYVPVKGK